MKKLVYLLVMCLCLNGMAEVPFAWLRSASAETQAPKAAKSSKSKKKKSSKSEADQDKKEEKSYKLDLSENSEAKMSDILKYAKLDIELKDIKKIELVKKSDKKYLAWEKDEENEDDYIFTVLKSFKKVELRISTKKTSRLLVLKNGKKASKPDEDMKKQEAPAEEKQEEPAKEKREAPAEEKQEEPVEEKKEEPAEEEREAPVEEKQEEPAEEKRETPVEEKQEEPAEEKREAPVEEKQEQPAEEKQEEPVEEKQEEPSEETQDAPAENEGEDANGEAEKQTEVENEATVTDPADEAVPQMEAGQTSAATDDPAKAAEDATSQANEQATEAATEQATEAATEQATEAATEPVTEAATEPVTEPAAEAATEQKAEAATEQATEATAESAGTPANASEGESGNAESASDDGQDAADQTAAGPEAKNEAPQAGIPEDAEAWFAGESATVAGTLQEIVGKLAGGETVNIHTSRTLLVEGASLELLSKVTVIPDPGMFDESYGVYFMPIRKSESQVQSNDAPSRPFDSQQLLSLIPSMGDRVDLCVWVEKNETPSQGEEQGQTGEKPVLNVKAKGVESQGWSRTQPEFTLSGIPEGKDWTYTAIIYDERFVPISGNFYTPAQEGGYNLRFAMLDELGDILALSDEYALMLDWTAPEVEIGEDGTTSFTLNVSATDKISGVDAVSVDGGKTWHRMDEGEYSVTNQQETTYKAGDVRVRDVAGNIFKSEEEYTVTEAENAEGDGEDGEGGDSGGGGGSFGGGGSGGGDGKAALPHSSGDGDEGADYDALELELPDEPMKQLTVGGEPMELTLMLASAQEAGAPVGDDQPFTARLRYWEDAAVDDAPNTLLLEAEIDDDLGDQFTYEWRFNGEVYRLLANSGIKYVALKVRDVVAAFPTEGFTGGTRYTELKMQGVSTRKFDYTLSMRINLDPAHVSAMTDSDYSEACDLSIHAEVEGKNYELSNSPQSMMYFYNVFVGPEDMLDQPFGEYDANA